MKLSNIFKKSTKAVATANIETLAKNQLEKVIGGTDTKTTVTVPKQTQGATFGEKVNAG